MNEKNEIKQKGKSLMKKSNITWLAYYLFWGIFIITILIAFTISNDRYEKKASAFCMKHDLNIADSCIICTKQCFKVNQDDTIIYYNIKKIKGKMYLIKVS